MANDRTRLPPLTNTSRELYLYSGNQCAFPECKEVLLKENGTWNCEAAHICGVGESAARGEHDLTNEELRSPANLLLLCPNHHVEIDNKALEATYTVDVVGQMKIDHEARFRSALVSLERIVDSTATASAKLPKNLRALPGFDRMTEEEERGNASSAAPFFDALVRQPPALRDVITLVLVHAGPQPTFRGRVTGPISAPLTKIEAAAQISREDLRGRVRALEHDGLVSLEDDGGAYLLELVDPTAKTIGWDLFASIHELAAGDRALIERIIDQLDFTAFDT